METNNLINIKDLYKELLNYMANSQEDALITSQKNISPKLKQLLSLIAELAGESNPINLAEHAVESRPNNAENKGAKSTILNKINNSLANHNLQNNNSNLANNINPRAKPKQSKRGSNLASNFNTKINGIANTLAILWQQDLPEKILLARRGMEWLGQDFNEDEVSFLNKMVSLGELISEDKKLKHSFGKKNYSREEAKKMRDQLSFDKEFISSIYNKNHAKHSSNLAKLHHLNSIIVG